MRLGARRDGTFVAPARVGRWDTGAYADTGPNVAAKGGWAARRPVPLRHVEVDSRCVYTNLPSAGAFRGYGATQAVWASRAVRRPARRAARADPLELRLRNVLRDGDRFATGETMHDFHVAECLERVAERIGWSAGTARQGPLRVMKGMQTPSRSRGPDRARRRGASRSRARPPTSARGATRACGSSPRARSGCDASIIDTAGVDTDSSPFDTRTTSSRSAHMMAGAIGNAARELRRRIADELEANPADVLFVGDAVEIVGSPGTRRALATFGSLQGSGEWVLDGGLDPDTGQGIASAHWHQGAAAIEVRVDGETGVTEIENLEVAVYAGRVVDASGAGLQNDGSIVMGIGSALFEATEYADGQMLTTTFSEYQVPAFSDVPPFAAEVIEGGEGADVHGLGETALPLDSRGARQRPAVARGRPRRACPSGPRRSSARSSRKAPGESAHHAQRRAAVVRDRGRRAADRRPRATPGSRACGWAAASASAAPAPSCSTASPSRAACCTPTLAEGREVTTVEGLAGDDPVLRAFDEAARVPVRLLHAGHGARPPSALLADGTRAPAARRCATGLNGNLCRCGSYRRIEQAIAAYLEEVSSVLLRDV